MLSSWFVVTPIIGYFYFFFAFVASAALYYKKSVGLALAYGIILFGTIATVVSYNTAFKKDGMFELTIVPLIVLNCLVVAYMAFNHDYFKSD